MSRLPFAARALIGIGACEDRTAAATCIETNVEWTKDRNEAKSKSITISAPRRALGLEFSCGTVVFLFMGKGGGTDGYLPPEVRLFLVGLRRPVAACTGMIPTLQLSQRKKDKSPNGGLPLPI
jgi:hypothetical protein